MDGQFVITISHLLGSAGALIGKKLSEELSVPFVDREILKAVSEELSLPQEDVERREERLTPFWEALLRLESFADPLNTDGMQYYPSDKELFELESRTIRRIAQEGSAVIFGRGGRFILRDLPNHLSIFVHADMEDRVRRISALFGVTAATARSMIEKNDRERSAYMKSFTHLEWLNASAYDLCLNTSAVGPEHAAELALKCFEYKFE